MGRKNAPGEIWTPKQIANALKVYCAVGGDHFFILCSQIGKRLWKATPVLPNVQEAMPR